MKGEIRSNYSPVGKSEITRRLKAIPWDALARERHWNELQSYSKVQ